jgi:hypothetical protein
MKFKLKLCKDTENATKIQQIRRALEERKKVSIVSTREWNSEKLIASDFQKNLN